MKWRCWLYQIFLVFGMTMLGYNVWRLINAASGNGHFRWNTTTGERVSLLIGALVGTALAIWLAIKNHEH